jgi:hypothetical protein
MVSHCHKALFVPLFFIIYYTFIPTVYVADIQLVRSAYQPPASSTFLSNKPSTSNQSAVLFSQNKSAPAISHQPNEQADQVMKFLRLLNSWLFTKKCCISYTSQQSILYIPDSLFLHISSSAPFPYAV